MRLTTAVLAYFTASLVSAAPASYTGDGTYYQPGLGACGKTNGPTDLIVAVSAGYFDSHRATVCGKAFTVRYRGKSVKVQVVDRCAGCAMGDLDLSPAAFKHLAPLAVGRIHGVNW